MVGNHFGMNLYIDNITVKIMDAPQCKLSTRKTVFSPKVVAVF